MMEWRFSCKMMFNNKDIVDVSLVLARLYLDPKKDILNERWNKVKKTFLKIAKNNTLYNELIKFLSENRVLEIVLENCNKINDNCLKVLIRDIQVQMKKNIKNVDATFIKDAPDFFKNDKIIMIKGSSLSQLYPLNYKRYQVDVDIIVQCIDDVWNVLKRTKKIYQYDRLKLYTSRNGKLSASIDLIPFDTNYPYIDVHVSPFEIWGSINYDIDLWKKADSLDNGLFIPSKEDMLILLTAHLAKQWMYRIRDINDCFLILRNYELDWDYIYTQCKKYNLIKLLSILMKRVEEVYELELHDERFKNNMTFFDNLFFKHNLGVQRVYTSFGIEFQYVFNYYKSNSNLFIALKNSLKNTKNLIVYKNRAYKINKKRKIKRFKENEIIVLKPTKKTFKLHNKRLLTGTSMFIVNEGEKDEYFETPVCNWIQSSYYVK